MSTVNWKELAYNSQISGCFLITDAKIGVSKAGKPFLSLKLSNGRDDIDAKKWDYNEGLPSVGDVINVEGQLREYMNSPQLILQRFEAAEEGTYSYRSFLPSLSEEILDQYEKELRSYMNGLGDPYQLFLTELFSLADHEKRYLHAPAAKIHHHAYLGGLLEHSLAVCKRALALADLSSLSVNKDILVTAALIHDIGKIFAYDYQRPPIQLSTRGKLLDHIVIGLSILSQTESSAPGILPEEEYLHLQHLIASHHGKLEWGSPVLPKTIEAEILHTADNLDAIDFKYNAAGENMAHDQEWSEWVKGLGKEVWIK